MLWRVLFKDAAGMGRFSDVNAATKEEAAWITATYECSDSLEFVCVKAVEDFRSPEGNSTQ